LSAARLSHLQQSLSQEETRRKRCREKEVQRKRCREVQSGRGGERAVPRV
jgi:hypothetical protein